MTCKHCRKRLWRTTEGRLTDRADGTDTLGSGQVCPVAYHHEIEE